MRFLVKKPRQKRKGQGIVEFALVLPILLLVVYGLLEVGRLIFMYATVSTASREAVRYGSATGLNITGSTQRYQDCSGIINAVQRVDFLNVIENENIVIAYDHGPGGGNFSGCPPAEVIPGDRITVQVSATFEPIVPIVPLDPIVITSTSARTLLVDVLVMPYVLP